MSHGYIRCCCHSMLPSFVPALIHCCLHSFPRSFIAALIHCCLYELLPSYIPSFLPLPDSFPPPFLRSVSSLPLSHPAFCLPPVASTLPRSFPAFIFGARDHPSLDLPHFTSSPTSLLRSSPYPILENRFCFVRVSTCRTTWQHTRSSWLAIATTYSSSTSLPPGRCACVCACACVCVCALAT